MQVGRLSRHPTRRMRASKIHLQACKVCDADNVGKIVKRGLIADFQVNYNTTAPLTVKYLFDD